MCSRQRRETSRLSPTRRECAVKLHRFETVLERVPCVQVGADWTESRMPQGATTLMEAAEGLGVHVSGVLYSRVVILASG